MSLVTEHLAERGVAFEVVPHRRAFTSLQEAGEVGVAAEEVLKTVALWTGGKYVLAVVLTSPRQRHPRPGDLRRPGPGAERIQVSVRDGIVLLEGTCQRRGLIPVLVRAVAGVEGVVRVENRLGFGLDDQSSPVMVFGLARRGLTPPAAR